VTGKSGLPGVNESQSAGYGDVAAALTPVLPPCSRGQAARVSQAAGVSGGPLG
jgi:hypothetical protein